MECRLTYLSSFRSFIPPLQNCTCIQCSVYLDNWWNLKSCKDGFKKFSKQKQNFSPVFKISIKFSTENSSQFKNQSKLVIECCLTYLSSFHLFIPPFQNCTCIELSVFLENQWSLRSCKNRLKKFSKQKQNFSPISKISIKFWTENCFQLKNQSKLVIEYRLIYLPFISSFLQTYIDRTVLDIPNWFNSDSL